MADVFLNFIDEWGYFAVALLMGLENACVPIPSELILGFAGYLIYAERMTFAGAMWAGMIGGVLGSIFAYEVGCRGGRPFVDRYGKYFFVKSFEEDFDGILGDNHESGSSIVDDARAAAARFKKSRKSRDRGGRRRRPERAEAPNVDIPVEGFEYVTDDEEEEVLADE